LRPPHHRRPRSRAGPGGHEGRAGRPGPPALRHLKPRIFLLRDAISALRCSPYGCAAALLEPTSRRSRRNLHDFNTVRTTHE
ncbi:MAG TPA: hypothetical protein PK306_14875, partial [Aquabacterium sp.]|nr:hypothetical protein [Aquabacterium sp.]